MNVPSVKANFLIMLTIGMFFVSAAFLFVQAQNDQQKLSQLPPAGSDDGSVGGSVGSSFGGTGFEEVRVAISAEIQAKAGGPEGELTVKAKILDGWHIYSITQPKGGPMPTKLALQSNPKIELTGPYQVEPAPSIHKDPDFDVPSEEHTGTVVWRAPVRMPKGFDPSSFKPELEAKGQVCEKVCVTFRDKVAVKLVGFQATSADTSTAEKSPTQSGSTLANAKVGPYRPKNSHVDVDIQVPQSVKPGAPFEILVLASPDDHYHVYPYADQASDELGTGKPTLFGLHLPAGWKRSAVKPERKPDFSSTDQSYYAQKIAWRIAIDVPKSAAGSAVIGGFVGIQTCKDDACDPPGAAEFRFTLDVGENSAPPSSPAISAPIAAAKYDVAAEWAARNAKQDYGRQDENLNADLPPAPQIGPDTSPVPPRPSESYNVVELDGTSVATLNLATALALAFAGGFMLNFMPCVLPVIGLKLMSFVNQSQGSRRQIFLLNLAYSAGIIAVFLGLALFSIYAKLGWGEQFNSPAFTIALTCLVFAFALSMLGVWEIPIPGFVGSGVTARMAEREGPMGAFSKGVLTTLLATPCTGPFMGSALTWSISQPTATTLLTFATLGLGMSSPYLVIGAFPALVKFLPKPGHWMETFKQLMGFVLMATVAFMFSFMKPDYIAATFGLLVGIWVACWMIGRTSITAEIDQKLKAWIGGGLIAAAIGWVSFQILVPHRFWAEYDPQLFASHLNDGKIVLVDFTAEWCLTCKLNERTALNIPTTNSLLEKHNVIAFRADYTGESEEIARLMDALEHRGHQLPLYAVFPGPGKPVITFQGPITAGTMARAIEKAVKIRADDSERVAASK